MQFTIPKPCHQRFEEMTPASGGRYCQSCSKIVIDFTSFTDAELIAFFQQHSQGVCGRLTENQLRSKPMPVNSKHSRLSIAMYIIGAGLSLFVPSKKTQAAIVDTLPVQMPAFKPVLIQPSPDISMITGTVADQNGNPIQGAAITLRGSTTGTVTGPEGNFVLHIPDSLQNTYYSLQINAIGFADQIISVSSPITKVQVKLDYEPGALLGDVIILGGCWKKKTRWQKVKAWFGHG